MKLKSKSCSKGLVVFLILCLVFAASFYFFAYHSSLLPALEKMDTNKKWYTEELQNMLLNKETTYRWDTSFRALSPVISIVFSSILGISFASSMILLSFLAGLATVYFLYFHFYEITLTKKPSSKEISTKRLLLPAIYIASPVVIQHSISYFIDILSFLFVFMIFYFTYMWIKQKEELKKSGSKYVLIIALLFALMISNRETSISYLAIFAAYAFYLSKLSFWKFVKKYFIPILFITAVSVIVLYGQYSLLFESKRHLIIGESEFGKQGDLMSVQFSDKISDMLNFFLTKQMFVFPFSFVFCFSLFSIFGIPAYIYSYFKDKKKKSKFLFFNIVLVLINILWGIISVGPRYVFYLVAPAFFVFSAYGLFELTGKIKKKHKKFNETLFYVLLIIANFIVSIALIYLYIEMHINPAFGSLILR